MASELMHFLISTIIEFLVLLFVGYEVTVGEIRHRRSAAAMTVGSSASAPKSRIGMRTGLFIVLITGAIWVLAAATYFSVAPLIPTAPESPNANTSPSTPQDVLALIGSLRSQLNSAKDTVEIQKRELDKTTHDLEIARHPLPRSGPLATASLSLSMGKDKEKPRELAADNVRWIIWDAPAWGAEMAWSRASQNPQTFLLTPSFSYPDLSALPNGAYHITKEGSDYKIYGDSKMSFIFLAFDKPTDTTNVQLSSDSTLPKWGYLCKDNAICTIRFDERPNNLSFTIRVGR